MAVPRKEKGGLSPEVWRMVEIFTAETIGTGMLVMFGCMSQLVWSEDIPINHWQGPVVFALVVAFVIQIFGHISGSHLNPAVTLCFVLLNLTTKAHSAVYVLAQFLGGILGFGLLKVITPCDIFELSKRRISENICSTMPHPSVSDFQAIAYEFIATGTFVIMICAITDERNSQFGATVSLKFGAAILAIALTVGPSTGCSLNPARSLGPAIFNGAWEKQWIYMFAPMVSSLVTTLFYQTIFSLKTSPSVKETEEDLPLNDIKVKEKEENDIN